MAVNGFAGTFRVEQRESQAMAYMRGRGLSINWIARALDRSTATIHAWVGNMAVPDNRRQAPSSRTKGVRAFNDGLGLLRLRLRMFFDGWYETLTEALASRAVPLDLLEFYEESENYSPDEPP